MDLKLVYREFSYYLFHGPEKKNQTGVSLLSLYVARFIEKGYCC